MSATTLNTAKEEEEYVWPTKVLECEKCRDHFTAENWKIRATCASVGMEIGLSQIEALEVYFNNFHKKKHPI